MKVLVRIVRRDLPLFLLVFGLAVVAFGGGLYLSLREAACPIPQSRESTMGYDPVINASLCLHPDETG